MPDCRSTLPVFLATLLLIVGRGFAANDPPVHMETPDDAQMPILRGEQATAPASVWERNGYLSIQVNVNAAGQNILGDAANEPSIAVDPHNPNRVAIGWRQFDTIQSNFRQAGWGWTDNGGSTWTFPGVIDPGVFRSDPVLDADDDGAFYYNSLTSDTVGFWCRVFKSIDGGMSWDNGVYAYGGDKQWMTIDRTSGIGRGNVYAYWTKSASCCNGHFTRSYNSGANFLATIDVPSNPQWGTLAVGPDGELYIAGWGFVVAKSSTIQDPNLSPQFDFATTVSLDGSLSFSGGPNPGGLLGQAWIAVDHSSDATRGNVYLLASVNRFSIADPADVMFARSTDGGVTWSAPVRVNDDTPGNGAYQWFATMSVAPNGRIDAIWNDTRNTASFTQSELHYSYSLDAGQTWSANVAVSPVFNSTIGWPQQNKIGDYYDMVSDTAGVSIAYSATFNGEQDVYYMRIGEFDCNANGLPDTDDIAAGTSFDCNSNSVPDECDRDCNANGVPDQCDIAAGTSFDCNNNAQADECETPDCNANFVPDACEIAAGTSPDCNGNGVPDGCDLAAGFDSDCNGNSVPDACDVADLAARIVAPTAAAPCPLAAAVFTVEATGATGYQWYTGGVAMVDGNGINGSATSMLMIDQATIADEGVYHCVVSEDCISTASSAATLTLAPTVFAITQEPAAEVILCAELGQSAVLTIQLDNDLRADYQWSKDGVTLVDGGRIAGTQTNSMSITAVQVSDLGVYTCHAENPCGASADSDPARGKVTIVDAVFTQDATSTCVEPGGTATFAVATQTPPGFGFYWYRDGDVVADGVDGMGAVISGARTDTLLIDNVPSAYDGSVFYATAIVPDPVCLTDSGEGVLLVGDCPSCAVPGDMDADGDNDLLDLQAFAACFGADVQLVPQCACANLDAIDSIVGLDDWARLAAVLLGPR